MITITKPVMDEREAEAGTRDLITAVLNIETKRIRTGVQDGLARAHADDDKGIVTRIGTTRRLF